MAVRSPVEIVRGSGLPTALQNAVLAVSGKLRLNAAERADVARELCAHFRDGLEAGASEGELIARFGDAKSAAMLISRAKRRQRGPVYQTLRRMAQGVGVLAVVMLVAYVYLAARFFLVSPSPSVDYLVQLNAQATSVPAEHRAWPGIKAAMLATSRASSESIGRNASLPYCAPDSEEFRSAKLELAALQGPLETLRTAAKLPVLGRELTRHGDMDPELAAHLKIDLAPSERDAFDRLLIGVLLPELGELRRYARLLCFDARLAAETGDGERAAESIRAVFDIARLIRQQPTLISDLVSQAIMTMGVSTLAEVLLRHPEALSDGTLIELAHVLSMYASLAGDMEGGPLSLSLHGERAMFMDAVQHIYSDDGRGDGRLTARGLRTLSQLVTISVQGGGEDSGAGFGTMAVGPVVAAVASGRLRTVSEYDEVMRLVENRATTPMWKWTIASSADLAVVARTSKGIGGPLDVGRLLTPALDRYVIGCNTSAMTREAGLTMIALELHRRRHGSFPERLEDLGRNVLPVRPIDRFTGQLLRYRRSGDGAESRYVLYSVGTDYTDDGGRMFSDSASALGWRVREWVERARVSGGGGEAAFIGLDHVYMPPQHLMPKTPGSSVSDSAGSSEAPPADSKDAPAGM